ncbi:MAG: hypothetical protein P8170_13205 [Gemmatimonadota bacterium]
MRLLLREYQAEGPLRDRPIEIPEGGVELKLAPLAWLYHAAAQPARDTVIDVYRIHTFPRPELHQFVLTVDESVPWVSEWRLGRHITGNQQVDSLMARYEADLVSYRSSGAGEGFVLLEAGLPLNVQGLGARFEAVTGVLESYPNTRGGDGADIVLEDSSAGWLLTFSVGWGDCIAGCTERHFWKFSVREDGAVQYVDGWGSDLSGYVVSASEG